MTKDNHFQQYGYDHYLKSPKRPRDEGFTEEPSGRMKLGPGAMTMALLLTGAVFATVIVTSYPSSDSRRGEIPIVKADLRPVKSQPDDPGGMDIPNRESTILARVGEPPAQDGLENLLESPDEAMMSREEAIQSAMADAEYLSPEEGLEAAPAPVEVKPEDVLQKIDETQQAAAAAPADGVQSMELHEAGTSPETKDFVRNALEQAKSAEDAVKKPAIEIKQAQIKDAATGAVSDAAKYSAPVQENLASAADIAPVVEPEDEPVMAQIHEEPSAQAVSAIEPAAGMASPAPKINAAPGGYYVQLASVPSRSGTESEWAKLQKKFGSIIGGMKYRVQEASLGARGTFYRIQAGPISKDSANEICNEIKALSPNGCLVVKK